MPTSLYEFNTEQNFNTAWIYVRPTSNLNGEDNPKVPRYLANRQSEKGSWGLVVDGEVITQNEAFVGYEPTFGIAGGGNYSVGDLKYTSPTYNDRQDTSTTETQQTGQNFIGGPQGNGIYSGSTTTETAWYVFDQTGGDPWTVIMWEGDIIFFGTLSQYNQFDNPGVSLPFGDVTYDERTNAGSTLTVQSSESTLHKYTRGQAVARATIPTSIGGMTPPMTSQAGIDAGAPQSGNYTVHKVAKEIFGTTQQVLVPSSLDQNTYYEFYEVLWTEASEVNNYSASAVIILPTHILQRSIAQRSVAMKFNGLDLSESYIRVASDMASGLGEVKDLRDNYGIEAQAIPIVLSIGGNAIVLGINQIEDIALNNARDKHVLRYDEESKVWKNVFAADVAFSGSYFSLVDAPATPSIENMPDTEISNTLADENVLKWDDSLQKWVNAPETAEVNDLSSAVTWTNIPDLYITESSVTQHQDALSITQSQITDLQHYTDVDVNTHLNQGTATTGQVLSWDGSDYSWTTPFDGAYGSLSGTPSIPALVTDLSITDGTNGQVLTTDGSGGFTFTTVTGGGGGGSYTDTSVDTHLNQGTATTGQVLSWDGSDYSWTTQSSGGGSSTRTTLAISTTALAVGQKSNLNIALPSTYVLLGVQIDNPAWITIYTSNTDLTADSSRQMTSDPNPNSGVVAEVIHQTSGASGLIEFSPSVVGFKSTGTNNTLAKVENIGSSTATIGITLHYLQLEV